MEIRRSSPSSRPSMRRASPSRAKPHRLSLRCSPAAARSKPTASAATRRARRGKGKRRWEKRPDGSALEETLDAARKSTDRPRSRASGGDVRSADPRTLSALVTSDFSNRWPAGEITGSVGVDPEMEQNMAPSTRAPRTRTDPLSVRRAELASGAVRDAGERATPACGRDRQVRRQLRDLTACARRGLSASAAARRVAEKSKIARGAPSAERASARAPNVFVFHRDRLCRSRLRNQTGRVSGFG